MKRFSKMHLFKWAGLFSVLMILVALAGFTKPTRSATPPDPVSLLSESYGFLDQIEEFSRPFYLVALAQAGARIQVPRQQEAEWCKEAFSLSHNVRNPWDRVSVQKNVVVALSAVNAKAAMELLWQMDEPVLDERGQLPEDVRNDAAVVAFPRYWEEARADGGDGATALVEIQRLSAHIGETGEYPYLAAANLIQKLSAETSHASTINQLFGEAFRFYSEGKLKAENRNEKFLVLIQKAKSAVSDLSLLSAAAESLANNLKVHNSGDFEGEYQTAEGQTVKFIDQNRALLFKAFPTIRDVDPALAKILLREDGEFGKATETMTYISGGVIEFNTTPQEAATLHHRMRQISLMAVIQAKQQTDPVGAKLLAETLTDTGLRFEAVSSTLPGLARADAAAAKAVYIDQRTQLQELADDGTRVRALVALAKAASSVDDDDFNVMSSRAFEEGVKVYSLDYRQRPDLRADLHPGYGELREIVRFSTMHNVNWVNRIRLLQNVELRGRLLDIVAEGLAGNSPGSASAAGQSR